MRMASRTEMPPGTVVAFPKSMVHQARAFCMLLSHDTLVVTRHAPSLHAIQTYPDPCPTYPDLTNCGSSRATTHSCLYTSDHTLDPLSPLIPPSWATRLASASSRCTCTVGTTSATMTPPASPTAPASTMCVLAESTSSTAAPSWRCHLLPRPTPCRGSRWAMPGKSIVCTVRFHRTRLTIAG